MQVLYISGSGRSGSTLVERLLHAGGMGCALGEFHCLWRLPKDQQTCACGTPMADDLFWKAVIERAGLTGPDLLELGSLEQAVVRTGFIARAGFNLARLREQSEVQRFLELQFRLFAAIAGESGQSVLIDSSKAGPRAWILACDPRVEFLHLWRNPADVIGSWRSKKFDRGLGSEMQRLSIAHAAADWAKVEMLMRRLSRQRKVVSLDYRTICVSPHAVFERALCDLGLPPIDAAAWIGSHTMIPIQDYHSLNGNPDRFDREPITVLLRETNWSKLPKLEAALVRALGKAIAIAYPAPQVR